MFSICLENWGKRAWISAGEFCAASLRAGAAGPDHRLGAWVREQFRTTWPPFPASSVPGLAGGDPQSGGGLDGTHTLGRVARLPPPIPGQYAGRGTTWQERAARDGAAPWCVKAEAEPECLVSSQGTHSSPRAAGRRGGVRGGGPRGNPRPG